MGLDFDPGPTGTYGQVINFGREEEQKAVLANSFSEFVQSFVKDLETGRALIENKGNQLVFLPKKFEWRFRGKVRGLLGGDVAHLFIEEPTHEE